jgi:3-oxoacyl-[acyl-carrier protein] reductase
VEKRLSGRVAIITGAAGGIGVGLAQRFAEEGAKLFLVDKVDKELEELAQNVRASGGECETICIDLTAKSATDSIVRTCVEAFGGIDILVNNAGIGGSRAIHELEDEDWDEMMTANLASVFRLSKRALPELKRSSQARIINITSVFGILGFRSSANYAAAKSGVIGLTRAMAADYAWDEITVNAVAPGVIASKMSQRNFDTKPWYKQVMLDATPIHRQGTPADVAAAVAFLASADASYITGHVLAVDGGWSVTKVLALEN